MSIAVNSGSESKAICGMARRPRSQGWTSAQPDSSESMIARHAVQKIFDITFNLLHVRRFKANIAMNKFTVGINQVG